MRDNVGEERKKEKEEKKGERKERERSEIRILGRT